MFKFREVNYILQRVEIPSTSAGSLRSRLWCFRRANAFLGMFRQIISSSTARRRREKRGASDDDDDDGEDWLRL